MQRMSSSIFTGFGSSSNWVGFSSHPCMYRPSQVVVVTFIVMLSLVCMSMAHIFRLERLHPMPSNHTMGMDVHRARARARDRVRHTVLLRSDVVDGAAIHFDVFGDADQYIVGLYYTKVRLGTPPREYSVQIDTGSDLLWVSCSSCSSCSRTSLLVSELNFFDPASSTTAQLVSCSYPVCPAVSHCSNKALQCSYSMRYADYSRTSGYYVADRIYLESISANSTTAISSASIAFGCSTDVVGGLVSPRRALDGIFGFGQQQASVISQLGSKGIMPWVFSHCLKGGDNGGGIFVLGEIVFSGIVYTPLMPSQPHYDVKLESISINGQPLPIDQAVFGNSQDRGAIVDSGTTLTYFPEEAYDAFVDAISAAVSQLPFMSDGNPCYLASTSLNDLFPHVNLNFLGGSSMVLSPEEYLQPGDYIPVGQAGARVWCIGFQKSEQALTILGDLVLKNKIVVYDLGHRRIGWANYDCSLPVNVSVTFGNTGQLSYGSAFIFPALVLQIVFLLELL